MLCVITLRVHILLPSWSGFSRIRTNCQRKITVAFRSGSVINFWGKRNLLIVLAESSKIKGLVHPFSDIDECAKGSHKCSADAVCNNTKASYNCTCNPGYYGNGRGCKAGNYKVFDIFSTFKGVLARDISSKQMLWTYSLSLRNA